LPPKQVQRNAIKVLAGAPDIADLYRARQRRHAQGP
jgi:hypothetical protein